MAYQFVFKRHEVKYLLTDEQVALVMKGMSEHMRPDEHGRSTLCNIYFDTPDYLLIRRSLEHPLYKEKIRVRSYGVARPSTPAFVELKKKYRRTVYKRRVSTTEREAMAYMCDGVALPPSQIVRELDFCRARYDRLEPRVFLSYEREAFFDQSDREFRITFDRNVLWRDYDLSLRAGVYGETLLPEGITLMEVKAGGAYPLWVSSLLSELDLYPGHFSKYGHAYQRILTSAGETAGNVFEGRCA